jgi:hypothetical protein
MTGFLPTGYKRPETAGGSYAKLEDGANKYRILSGAIVGWLYWTTENKPVRLKERPQTAPADIREGDKIKHMWAFVVWSYRDNKVQILELTQASIQGPLEDLVMSDEWGDPKEYDITITKTGQKLDTEYTVMPSPKKAVPVDAHKAYRETPINLEALFSGSDPFTTSAGSEVADTITPEDSPFGPDVL